MTDVLDSGGEKKPTRKGKKGIRVGLEHSFVVRKQEWFYSRKDSVGRTKEWAKGLLQKKFYKVKH